jgi:hypothetical protein
MHISKAAAVLNVANLKNWIGRNYSKGYLSICLNALSHTALHYLFHFNQENEVNEVIINENENVNPVTPNIITPNTTDQNVRFFTQSDNNMFSKDKLEIDLFSFKIKLKEEIDLFTKFLKTGSNFKKIKIFIK